MNNHERVVKWKRDAEAKGAQVSIQEWWPIAEGIHISATVVLGSPQLELDFGDEEWP